MQKAYLYTFIAGLFGLAWWIGHSGFDEILEGYASRSWPQVTGYVRFAKAIEEEDSEEEEYYRLEVEYQYEVGGIIFNGNRFAIREWESNDFDVVAKYVKQYRETQNAAVFYDPENPRRSLLHPGMLIESFLGPGFAAVLILFALVLIAGESGGGVKNLSRKNPG